MSDVVRLPGCDENEGQAGVACETVARRKSRRRPDSVETIERKRAAAAAHWADPARRAAQGEKTRRRMDRPEVRAKISAGVRAAMADPQVRADKAALLRQRFADPALRLRISEATKAGMAAKAIMDREQ
jgi:hypothetical protein